MFIAWALPNNFSAIRTPCRYVLRSAFVTFSIVRVVTHGIDHQARIVFERGGGLQIEISHHRAARATAFQNARSGAHCQIGGDHHPRLTQGNSHHVEFARMADLHMRHDRAVLLREPGEVQDRDVPAFQVRRHGQNGTGGHDSPAADPSEQPPPWRLDR